MSLHGPDKPRCEEASPWSMGIYVACGAPATTIIWHGRSERPYWMCDHCAHHNVHNRGGQILWPRQEND